VRADVEVVGAEEFDGLVDERVVEDDGAEDGALGVGAVRQRALEHLFARRINGVSSHRELGLRKRKRAVEN